MDEMLNRIVIDIIAVCFPVAIVWFAPKITAPNYYEIYDKFAKQNPEKDKEEIDYIVTKKCLKRKLLVCLIMFLVGSAGMISLGYLNSHTEAWWYSLVIAPSAIIQIGGVINLARALHDPISLSESRYLAKKDRWEKAGETVEEENNKRKQSETSKEENSHA